MLRAQRVAVLYSVFCILYSVLICLPAFAQEKPAKKPPGKQEEDHIHGHPEWKHPNKAEKPFFKSVDDLRKFGEPHMRRSHISLVGNLGKGKRQGIRSELMSFGLDKVILHLQGDHDFGVRRACPETITKLCDKKGVDERVKYLKEKIEAGEKVVETPDKVVKAFQEQLDKARKALLKALKEDKKNEVREQCAGFLPHIARDKKVVDALTNALLSDGWSMVREMAVNSLMIIEDRSSIEALRKALEKDTHSTVRAAAAKALLKFGDKGAAKLFKEGLKDGWSNVRLECIRALAQFGTKDTIKPLMERLSDKKDIVREEAAIALGSIGDASALPALGKTSSDEYETVRESVYKAIAGVAKRYKSGARLAATMLADQKVDDKTFNAKIPGIANLINLLAAGDIADAKKLLSSCQEGSTDNRMAARKEAYKLVAAIAERAKSTTRQAADILARKGLPDAVFNPRIMAIRGLLQLADKRGVEALMGALKEKYIFRKLSAIRVAVEEKVKDPVFLKALTELAKSGKTEPMVKKKANEALAALEK